MMVRRLVFLMLAAVISIATVIVARNWMQAQLAARQPAAAPAAPAAKAGPMVLVAKGTLAAGQFLRPENMRWQAWPENGVADSYVVQGKGALEDYVGSVVRSFVADGEPIVDGKIVRPGDRGFVAAVLTPGMRAVTVPVTASSGLAGLVFPGDHVDVILTMTIQPEKNDGQKDGPERRASETVLSDIRVLATDQRIDDEKHETTVAKTATLEVTPKQAEIITVANEMGKLALSLRSLGQGDGAAAPDNSHTWDIEAAHLLAAVPHPSSSRGAGRKVSVVRGSEAKDVEFTTTAGAAPPHGQVASGEVPQ